MNFDERLRDGLAANDSQPLTGPGTTVVKQRARRRTQNRQTATYAVSALVLGAGTFGGLNVLGNESDYLANQPDATSETDQTDSTSEQQPPPSEVKVLTDLISEQRSFPEVVAEPPDNIGISENTVYTHTIEYPDSRTEPFHVFSKTENGLDREELGRFKAADTNIGGGDSRTFTVHKGSLYWSTTESGRFVVKKSDDFGRTWETSAELDTDWVVRRGVLPATVWITSTDESLLAYGFFDDTPLEEQQDGKARPTEQRALASTDQGATWRETTPPSLEIVAVPDRFFSLDYASTDLDDYEVVESTDGVTWTPSSTSRLPSQGYGSRLVIESGLESDSYPLLSTDSGVTWKEVDFESILADTELAGLTIEEIDDRGGVGEAGFAFVVSKVDDSRSYKPAPDNTPYALISEDGETWHVEKLPEVESGEGFEYPRPTVTADHFTFLHGTNDLYVLDRSQTWTAITLRLP